MATVADALNLMLWVLVIGLVGLFVIASVVDLWSWWRKQQTLREQRGYQKQVIEKQEIQPIGAGGPGPWLESPEHTAYPPVLYGDRRTHQLLQILWTKAVGTAGYKKEEWIELERILRRRR